VGRHAVRILARAWLNVIWKRWTTNTPTIQPSSERYNNYSNPAVDTEHSLRGPA
jgi:hypothetical protein